MGDLRNPAELKEIWQTWHENVGRPMRQDYTRMVEIANQGAKELGYRRHRRDVAVELRHVAGRILGDVRPAVGGDEAALRPAPLLHADQAQPEVRRCRAARDRPDPCRSARQHVGAGMGQHLRCRRAARVLATSATTSDRPAGGEEEDRRPRWFEIGEGFYTSLGFAPLPKTFWQRSQFVRPRDREVICHASAWDLDNKDDLRIKMCTKVNADDFVTIHHELGPQLLSARLQPAALPLSQRRQRRLPRGDRRLRRSVGDAGISRPDRAARSKQGPVDATRTPACCCARRWTRSPSCRSV